MLYKRKGARNWTCEFTYKGREVKQTTGTSSKAEAMAWEVAKRRELKADHEAKRAGVKRMTLFALAEVWLHVTQTTHRDPLVNRSRVRKLFGDAMVLRCVKRTREWVLTPNARAGLSKDLMVHELTQAHLMQLKSDRLAEGVAAATINREVSLVQALLGFARSIACVVPDAPIAWSSRHNPAASLRMRESRGRLRWLRSHEESKLLDALRARAEETPDDMRLRDAYELTMLLLDTGARYSEIARLRWDMFDLAAGTVSLYRFKVDNESTLKLPQRSLRMLRDRWERMKDLGYSVVFPRFVKRHWVKEDIPRRYTTKAIQTVIDRCGLNDDPGQDRVTPHTFRHTFASKLLQAGYSLSKVSKLLGHANEQTTQIYAHLCIDDASVEAAAVLDRLNGDQPAAGEDIEPAEVSKVSPRVIGWTPRLVA